VQSRRRDGGKRNHLGILADELGKMGKVMIKVKLSNYVDMEKALRGIIPPEEVRAVEIEALVDTGATMLVLPGPVVERLGVPLLRYNDVRYANGHTARVARVGGIWFEVLGRDMTCDALVEPEGKLALIGQIQLEALDLIVDPKSRELRVNPENPDTETLDLYAVG
jgi:predicted aspartyl protease